MQLISPEFTEDLVTTLKVACAQSGVTLTELCARAGINRSSIERWKIKTPKTIEILKRLQDALIELKKEKDAGAAALPE